MAYIQAQLRPMSPPCPPSTPRCEPQHGFEEGGSPPPPSCDMVYLGARLQMVSFLGLSDCSCTKEGRQCHFAVTDTTGHDVDAEDPSSGSASPLDEDDATVIDSSSPVPSRWSEAETILENPAGLQLGNWDLMKHRTSARSYQELWPSSPTSLAHTMPSASSLVPDTLSPAQASPREVRASYPQPKIRTARISPPILDAASVNAASFVSMSHPASTKVQPLPELVPYHPHRSVPTPNEQSMQSKFDSYSDEEEDDDGDGEEAIDKNDRRERRPLGRFRRRVSSGFQNLLCRSG